ncbi:DUF6309 family protein [Nocardiopsis ansamitocini]|uniref:Uncharacterized protein n=1 Tax=Nocardiopsis ansamitocini TaxID=1670832 RepID=A0A9W6P7W2_9ACTN|nr:DUF6309 family protein [Nocardiopsis ansamitocini]GLU48637.1 hypothetical protein Nans01_29880 [Nocardiopsis ansamitocini]
MEILERVAFSDVRLDYLNEHPAERDHAGNTNQSGEENLWRAEKLLGVWWRVRLSRPEVLSVVLPWHTAEGGEFELIPPSGLTVGQVAARVRAFSTDIEKANPVCTAKMRVLGQAPITPVHLSTLAVDHIDYAGLPCREGLIHLDGLHRMLAWELTGRLANGPGLEVLIAGDPEGPTGPHTAEGPDGGSSGSTGDERE